MTAELSQGHSRRWSAPRSGSPHSRKAALSRALAATLLLVLLGAINAVLGVGSASAQSPPETGSAAAPDLKLLGTALRESAELNEEQRAPLLLKLQEATDWLAKADQWRKEAARYTQAAATVDAQVQQYQKLMREAGAKRADPSARLTENTPLADIEAEISLIVAQRKAWAEQRQDVAQQTERERALDTSASERLVKVTQELSALKAPATTGDAGLEQKINDAALLARIQALEAEQELLKQRERGAAALKEILVAQRAWLDAAIAAADEQLEALRERATQTRQSRVTREIEWTRSLLARLDSPPASLAEFLERNLELIGEQQSLVDQLERSRTEITSLRETLERLNEDAKLTRRRLDVAGLESTLGKVMLTRLASLPDTRVITSRSAQRNALISRYALVSIDHEEDLNAIADRRRFLDSTFGARADWSGQARAALYALYEQRRTLLRDNLQTAGTLLKLLVDSNEVATALIGTTETYEQFLTANLLWTSNYDYANPARLWSQLNLLASTEAPLSVAAGLPYSLLEPRIALLSLLLLVLLYVRPRIKRAQAELLERPIRPRDENSTKIFLALLLALLYVLPIPLAVYLLSLPFAAVGESSVQAEGLGRALRDLSALMLCLGLLRAITSKFGVGRRLLKWNSQKIDQLRRELHWAYPLLIIATATNSFGLVTAPATSGGALSALATLTLSMVLLVLSVRVLLREIFKGDRFLHTLFRLSAGLSLAIVIMHLSGHLFAAHQYLRSTLLSIGALIVVISATNILQRVLLITRANIERRSREALRRAEDEAEEAGDNRDERDESRDLDEVTQLSEAHNRLLGLSRFLGLSVLLWLIWSPALPALNILNEVVLWQVSDATLPEGELRAVSLSTLLLVLAIIVITSLMTRHLPALVKVVLMEWANVTAGSRYAIGMLMQYVLIGVGLSVSLSLLGWEWSKVQWLVAALGVGIGFGLQEIVANFISGIILLFERPIRVGDVITAGGDSGTVTRINPRATIIESFEGKELMIPNKELITSVVINWSLSSSKLRVVIPVGVAYGSDVREAMRLLVEVAKDNGSVISEPAPMASFEDFGDNALTLWLRCYAEGEYVRVWTELRTEINERFNAAGISIAFPQRDVHLDAARPIPVQVIAPESRNEAPPSPAV